jgi:hypothetical protein
MAVAAWLHEAMAALEADREAIATMAALAESRWLAWQTFGRIDTAEPWAQLRVRFDELDRTFAAALEPLRQLAAAVDRGGREEE